jgi:hypothetical protein
VKEALCCDAPVVSVDVGDVGQLARVAPGCTVVQPTVEDIARGLGAVLRKPMRVDGAMVRRNLDAGVVALRVLRLYEEVRRRCSR